MAPSVHHVQDESHKEQFSLSLPIIKTNKQSKNVNTNVIKYACHALLHCFTPKQKAKTTEYTQSYEV